MSEQIVKPKNLSECFKHLDEIFSKSPDKDWFKNEKEEKVVANSHHGLGQWIRNNWSLWSKDEGLYQYFKKLGLHHADDMSSLIIISYHRYINKKELNLEEQIKYYIDYWKNIK